MKPMGHVFQTFFSMDEAAFEALIAELGYESAACYRLKDGAFTFVIGTSASAWPAFFRLDQLNCTTEQSDDVPLGWVKNPFAGPQKKLWPKGLLAYFPEQELRITKFVLLATPRIRRKIDAGTLDGYLEALIGRIAHWTAGAEMRQFINEGIMHEHTRKLSMHTQTLIDHELRTPLSNIQGYGFLLREERKPETITQFADIILSQVDVAMAAIEKLSLTIRSSLGDAKDSGTAKPFNLKNLVDAACAEVVSRDMAERGGGEPVDIKVVCSEEVKDRFMVGSEVLLHRAISEVIHNAVLYSQHGSIKLALYSNDDSAIVDIEDDGEGVPQGAEDLIFLQFFRGHNNQKIRRGHRGLGLGLYLARYIAEQHLGQLQCVRRLQKGALFRFILPLSNEADLPQTRLVG